MLAEDEGLNLGQSFKKRETTADDTLLILKTLWGSGHHIVCSPSARVAFHCAILLQGIGGWRQQSVIRLKYRDVELSWQRDPVDPTKTWPIATITIHHVKQKKHVIRRNQRDLYVTHRDAAVILPCCAYYSGANWCTDYSSPSLACLARTSAFSPSLYA